MHHHLAPPPASHNMTDERVDVIFRPLTLAPVSAPTMICGFGDLALFFSLPLLSFIARILRTCLEVGVEEQRKQVER